MSFSKADIVTGIRSNTGFLHNRSTETVEILHEIIKHTLASGEDALVSGFGSSMSRINGGGGEEILQPVEM